MGHNITLETKVRDLSVRMLKTICEALVLGTGDYGAYVNDTLGEMITWGVEVRVRVGLRFWAPSVTRFNEYTTKQQHQACERLFRSVSCLTKYFYKRRDNRWVIMAPRRGFVKLS